ncbi:MAG: membrane protein insertion efficiency factor YidD [Christensenellales bacterium]
MSKTAQRILIAIIGFYKKRISPIFPPACRFQPTCSAYAAEAIAKYGAGKGSWLAFKRILRCNPFCKGGYDPVP